MIRPETRHLGRQRRLTQNSGEHWAVQRLAGASGQTSKPGREAALAGDNAMTAILELHSKTTRNYLYLYPIANEKAPGRPVGNVERKTNWRAGIEPNETYRGSKVQQPCTIRA